MGACQLGFCFTWYIRYIKIVIIASFDQNVFTYLLNTRISWCFDLPVWRISSTSRERACPGHWSLISENHPFCIWFISLSLSFFCYFVLFMCLFVCFFFFCYNFFVLQLWRKNNMVTKLFFLLLLFCLVSIIQTECGLFKNWARQGKVRLSDFQ